MFVLKSITIVVYCIEKRLISLFRLPCFSNIITVLQNLNTFQNSKSNLVQVVHEERIREPEFSRRQNFFENIKSGIMGKQGLPYKYLIPFV